MNAFVEWARIRNRALAMVDGYAPDRTTTDIQLIRKRWSLGPFLRFDACKKILIRPTVSDPNRLCFKVFPVYTVGIFCFKFTVALPVRSHTILL